MKKETALDIAKEIFSSKISHGKANDSPPPELDNIFMPFFIDLHQKQTKELVHTMIRLKALKVLVCN